jgi:hypothetical protein
VISSVRSADAASTPASGTSKPVPRRPASRARNADGIDATSPLAQQQSEIQLALAAQAARFDAMMKVLAEQQREINAIVDFGMAQAKRDDQLMNEWIRLI